MPIYTRYLTTAEFGTANLITQISSLLFALVSMEIAESVFRFSFDKEGDRAEVFSIGLYFTLIGSAIIAILAPLFYLSGFAFFRENMWLIVSLVATTALIILLNQHLRAKGRFTLFAIKGIVNTLLVIVFNLTFLILLDMGMLGFVLSVIIGNCITIVFVVIVDKTWRDILPPSKINNSTVKAMLKYSTPLVPTLAFWWVANSSGMFLIRYFVGDDVTGLYTAALKIPTLLTITCNTFFQAWGVSSFAEETEEKRSAFFSRIFGYFQAVLFLAAVGMVMMSRTIVNFMFDSSFHEAWRFTPLLIISSIFFCLSVFKSSVFMVKKNSIAPFLTAFAGAVINIILNLILIPEEFLGITMVGLGGYGAAISAIVSFIVIYILRSIQAKNFLKYNQHRAKVAIGAIIIIAQAAMTLYSPPWRLAGHFAAIVLILLLNASAIIEGVKYVLEKRPRKKRGTDVN